MSALSLRNVSNPHFEDAEQIKKRLHNEVKNGFDFTTDLIGIDTAKVNKVPTFEGPDLSSIRFQPFKERDYFGNSWLLNTDYKFGRDPNNPILKDFKFKTFDSAGIFNKTSATDAGVKDAMDDLKTKQSKHGDITGYVTDAAANYGLQNKTWDDIAEGKKQVEDLTTDVTRDALDHGFINQMKLDRLQRRSKKVYGSEQMQEKAFETTTDSIIASSSLLKEYKKDVKATKTGIMDNKKAGVLIEPVIKEAIPLLAGLGKGNKIARNKRFASFLNRKGGAKPPESSLPDAQPTTPKKPTAAEAQALYNAAKEAVKSPAQSPVKTPVKAAIVKPEKAAIVEAELALLKQGKEETKQDQLEEIQRDEVLQNVVDKYTTATGFNTVEKATAGATAIFRQVESLTDLEPNDIPRYNEVLLKLGLLASRATTLKGFKESIQKQISGLGTDETFAKTQKDRQKR